MKTSPDQKLANSSSFFCTRIGTTGGDRLEISVYGDAMISAPLNELREPWAIPWRLFFYEYFQFFWPGGGGGGGGGGAAVPPFVRACSLELVGFRGASPEYDSRVIFLTKSLSRNLGGENAVSWAFLR